MLLNDPLSDHLLGIYFGLQGRLNRVLSYFDPDVGANCRLCIRQRAGSAVDAVVKVGMVGPQILLVPQIRHFGAIGHHHKGLDIGLVFILTFVATVQLFYFLVLTMGGVIDVVVVTSVLIVRLLVEIVQDRRPILFNLDDVLVRNGEELDYLGQDSPPIGINQTRNHFVCHIPGGCTQHLFQLPC